MLKNISCIVLLCVGFIWQQCAYARWEKYADAASPLDFLYEQVNVNADGTYSNIVEQQWEITKDSARDDASHFWLTYVEYQESLEIIEAKTILAGKEYLLDKKTIEDKPLVSAAEGFDQTRQITIAYPNAELGAKIYLKYRYVLHKPELTSNFAETYYPGSNGYIKEYKLDLRSSILLASKINDPQAILRVQEKTNAGQYHLQVALKKPTSNTRYNEPENSQLNYGSVAWVSLSSFSSYPAVANLIAPEYNKVINEPLPAMFKAIAAEAAKQKTDVDKINKVTSLLNEKIQYKGDWISVEGKLFPHSLAQISARQLGDCKDYAASTAAILQALGFKADVALAYRGEGSAPNSDALPSLANFNHALVAVSNKDDKISWIDPTNFVSMAGQVFPDIAGKMAVILYTNAPAYQKIPEIELTQARWMVNSNIKQEQDSGAAIVSATLDFKGVSALGLTGFALNSSPESMREQIFNMFDSSLSEAERISLETSDLASRTVKDISLKATFKSHSALVRTNLGYAFTINSPQISTYLELNNSVEGDIYFGIPEQDLTTYTLQNMHAVNLDALNASFSSPWLNVSRVCHNTAAGVQVVIKKDVLKSYVSAAEIRSAEFKALQEALLKNFSGVALVFQPGAEAKGSL